VNQSMAAQPIIDRALGVLQLKDATYEEIEHDSNATAQAAIIVLLVGLASGIGAIGDEWYAIIVSPVAALIGWVIASALIFFVGTRITESPSTQADIGQVLRLYGFALVPGIVNILGFLGWFGDLLGFVAAVITLILIVKAIMHALEMSMLRAIATGLLALVGWIVSLLIIGLIFSIALVPFS
jgi:hypothetical protein